MVISNNGASVAGGAMAANVVHVPAPPTGTLQQGGPDATQTASMVTLGLESEEALAAVEAALQQAGLSATERDDASADVATIRAQPRGHV